MAEDRENPTNPKAAEATQVLPQEDPEVQVEKPTEDLEPLFENDEAEKFRTQWMNIQSEFVENPQASVREADKLVADVLKSVTIGFHDRRTSLERQWNNGNNISTEDLRLMLKRYRSFFNRLLTLKS